MPNEEERYPNYFDGSAHIEFSEELTAGQDAAQREETVDSEQWRRYISGNPYGTNGNA